MPVTIGFSDIISAIELVAKVVDALRESSDSSVEYRALISQLYMLETALLRVKRLELDDSQHDEVVSLRATAAQCQETIDLFWEKIKKYQPSLRTQGSGSRVRDGWMKIKWALCKKEDIVRFKADLLAHTASIEILLTTLQMASTRIDGKKNDQNHRTLAGKLQDSYFGCMRRIDIVLENLSIGIQQGIQLRDLTAKVIQTNIQIFQAVLSIQNVISRIPAQIDRQRPVYFVDALGRSTSFDLDFILSADALRSVLHWNFKHIGSGASKIEKGEFAIQDSATKRDVDLSSVWETCFYPRQHVAMSMVFNSMGPVTHCPKCQEKNGGSEDEDIECRTCKMIYRCSTSLISPQALSSNDLRKAQLPPQVEKFTSPIGERSALLKRPHDYEDDMALFRRVRIKTLVALPSAYSRRTSPATNSVKKRGIWNCICSLDSATFVASQLQCYKCNTSQHAHCYYRLAGYAPPPELHVCRDCVAVNLDRENITRRWKSNGEAMNLQILCRVPGCPNQQCYGTLCKSHYSPGRLDGAIGHGHFLAEPYYDSAVTSSHQCRGIPFTGDADVATFMDDDDLQSIYEKVPYLHGVMPSNDPLLSYPRTSISLPEEGIRLPRGGKSSQHSKSRPPVPLWPA